MATYHLFFHEIASPLLPWALMSMQVISRASIVCLSIYDTTYRTVALICALLTFASLDEGGPTSLCFKGPVQYQ